MTVVVSFPEFPGVVLSTEEFGEGMYLADVLNWFDGTAARLENEPRYGDDGDYPEEPVFSEARYPIVVGGVRFSDPARYVEAKRIISQIWAHRFPFTLQVDSGDGIRSAQVVRAGKPVWDLRDAPYRMTFELPLKAADPRKYGELRTASTGLPVSGGGVQSPVISPFTELGGGSEGRVILTNTGTTDTFATFHVTGGLSGGVELTRVETGERLRLEWPINPGNVITFDMAEGQVWIDDESPITGYLTRSQWWVLGAGETATVQFEGIGDVTGSPTLTVEWRDADA